VGGFVELKGLDACEPSTVFRQQITAGVCSGRCALEADVAGGGGSQGVGRRTAAATERVNASACGLARTPASSEAEERTTTIGTRAVWRRGTVNAKPPYDRLRVT
jgi:hypothetical protein